MANKKGTTRKSPSKKATTKKHTNLDNLKKDKENKKGKHGGAREGSGRKPSAEKERLQQLKEEAEMHAFGVVDVAITEGGETKKVKMARHIALLDVLFQEGLKRKSIPAIKEYFDRTRGKSVQPIAHSGEIKTEDQYIPDDPAVEAAHNAYMTERKKLIAQGYYDSIELDEGEE